MSQLKIGLVTSGRGTMLRYVMDACARRIVPGEVVAVASNVNCKALEVAKERGISAVRHWEEDRTSSAADRDEAMSHFLQESGVNLVLVAGYTERLSPVFFEPFPDRVISPYPSALPAFGDLDEAIGPALDYGVKLLVMTWHFHAPNSLSDGAIIAQQGIPVGPDDTIESISGPLTDIEMSMLWDILRSFAAGTIRREGRKVWMKPPGAAHREASRQEVLQ